MMRHAVASTCNTSASKVNVIGGYFGLSTFSITGKSSIEKVYHGKETMSHAHAAIERPETMEALMRKELDSGHNLRADLIKLNEKK